MISQLIAQYAQTEYDSGDDQAVADVLNTASIEVRDDQLYTWAGIALLAGPEAAEMLRVALEQNGMGWAVHQFGGTGLQMTNPLVRGAIEQFIAAGIQLQPMLDATVYFVSPAMQTLERAVTSEEVAEYRKLVIVSVKRSEIADRANELIGQLDTLETESMSVAEVQAFCDSLGGV